MVVVANRCEEVNRTKGDEECGKRRGRKGNEVKKKKKKGAATRRGPHHDPTTDYRKPFAQESLP